MADALEMALADQSVSAEVSRGGCLGLCFAEPLLDVQLPGGHRVFYGNVDAESVSEIVSVHVAGGTPIVSKALGYLAEETSLAPPPEGIPGEKDPDVVIELLTEIYGLISGPPGWRKTLLAALKEFGFNNHPLAPCVVVMYDETIKGHEKLWNLVGIISIETDDLLEGELVLSGKPRWNDLRKGSPSANGSGWMQAEQNMADVPYCN